MYYTIGTSILSAATMPLGLIMGRGKTRSTLGFRPFRIGNRWTKDHK